MPSILLTTLNAKYAHAAFGLRYLLANLGELKNEAKILEFTIQQRAIDIVETILSENPRIVGMGVYIWNAQLSYEVASLLKRIKPDLILVLGGPEVSYETAEQAIVREADYVICGEGEVAFRQLCQRVLAKQRPLVKIIQPSLPAIEELILPYHLYTNEDLRQRTVYVEASRGCPFSCEFCLSSLDVRVRTFALENFLAAMDQLWQRGLRHYKFIDRTFNLSNKISQAILEFFLARFESGTFLHFEIIPDRLPQPLRALICQFPPGALQFEIGIQTLDEATSERIQRRQNVTKVFENLHFLRNQSGAHLHTDLIVGLPGEDLDSFAYNFNQLIRLNVQEIQVGMLKRLRGTPIVRHDEEWGMVYSPHPPYEVLATQKIDFQSMQRIKRFARIWDLVGNSGNFIASSMLIWTDRSPYHAFLEFVDWLFIHIDSGQGIALSRLNQLLFQFLTEIRKLDRHQVGHTLAQDFLVTPNRKLPSFLREFIAEPLPPTHRQTSLPARQTRHLERRSPLQM